MLNFCEKRIIEITDTLTETGKLRKNTFIIALLLAVAGSIIVLPLGKIALVEKLRWILGFWIGLGTQLVNFHLLVRSTEALAAAVEGGNTVTKPKRHMLKGFFLRYLLMALALLLAYWISLSALLAAAVGVIVVQLALIICQLFGPTRAGG